MPDLPLPALHLRVPALEIQESEDFVREHVQRFIQALLEEEVTELLGRTKSARREAVDAAPGYRNGYGKRQWLTLKSGTITVCRPRVRDLNERFVSRVLPLFKRQTKEVGELLPQLYLYGLALGDFELALRGLLGDGAPLSPVSLSRRPQRSKEAVCTAQAVALRIPRG
jgi:putative transposase